MIYGDTVMCLIWLCLQNSTNSKALKHGPLALTIINGKHLRDMISRSALIVTSAVAESVGMISNHLENCQ